MDCSKTLNYFKEKNRMTDKCSIVCDTCPLSPRNNSYFIGCEDIANEYPQKAIAIVQKWSDEHPPKTILDDFLEKFPSVALDSKGFPKYICCRYLGYNLSFQGCMMTDDNFSCSGCWNQPFDGFIEESK